MQPRLKSIQHLDCRTLFLMIRNELLYLLLLLLSVSQPVTFVSDDVKNLDSK